MMFLGATSNEWVFVALVVGMVLGIPKLTKLGAWLATALPSRER